MINDIDIQVVGILVWLAMCLCVGVIGLCMGSRTVPDPVRPRQIGMIFHTEHDTDPLLPSGWNVDHGAFLSVFIDPYGSKYLMSGDKLYPWGICPPGEIAGSSLRPGERYIDTDNAIALPIAVKEL